MLTESIALGRSIERECARLGDLADAIRAALLGALTADDVAAAENQLLAARAYLVRARRIVGQLDGLVRAVEAERDARGRR